MYHFAVNGVQQGPVSEAELLSKIARGEVSASDLCWSAGWPQWRRVGEVFPSSAGAVPPLLPPEQSLRAEVVPGGKPKRSGLAVASLICGICTLLLFPLFFLFMIPAIVCGHVAQARIKQAKGALMGGGMALAGLIMGYSGIVMVPVVGLVAAVAFPAFNKVRVSSISKTMDNDARQIAGAAQRRAEEQRVAEIARAEEQRRVEQQRQAERERQAAAAARAEQERLAAAQAAAEQARRAAAERERATSVANTSGGSRGATSVAAGQSITIPGLNLELVPIAAGRFAMGSTNGGSDEQPVTQVEITRAFWLGKTEVTQGQWEAVMGNNPSSFKGATRPVEQVSYDDVVEFCRKLTARERAAGRLPSGYEYTLPTEAQWEYACRAGTTGDYSFGNNADELSRYGNYCDRSNTNDFDWKDKSHDDGQDKTAPVGSYRPNAWGLYDMHGNVWEWCLDWYTGTLPGGTVRDPVGPSSGSFRVFRGGSWYLTASNCRSALRCDCGPGARYYGLGFRLALSSVP